MFADDCTLYRCINRQESIADVTCEIQADLNSLANWTNKWQARFNPSKCEVMLITRTLRTHLSLALYGQTLPNVNQAKIVGLSFNNQLKFEDHLQHLATKGSRALGLLCKSAKFLTVSTRLQLYKALVRPHLEYASPIWNGSTQTSLQQLTRVQKRAIRKLQLSLSPELSQHIPPLAVRRDVASILLFRKHLVKPPIPSDPLITPSLPSEVRRVVTYTHNHPVQIPLSRTVSHQNSFIPRTSRLWNCMPACVADQYIHKKFGTYYYSALLQISYET